jgi:hypothetical protein
LVSKKLAVSTTIIIGLLSIISLSVARAASLEMSSNDVSEIYFFIVISSGVFVSIIIAHIMNVRTMQKTTYKNNFD